LNHAHFSHQTAPVGQDDIPVDLNRQVMNVSGWYAGTSPQGLFRSENAGDPGIRSQGLTIIQCARSGVKMTDRKAFPTDQNCTRF
jgi:hypothetical protein